MTETYFVKNLPSPLQALYRPMLLISVGLHGLLVMLPMPSEKKPPAPAKEKAPEQVQVTQLSTTPPVPTPAVRPSPQLRSTPKPSPIARQAPRPQPTPIRQQSAIPPVSQTKPLTRRQTPVEQPSPEPSPEPTPSPQATQSKQPQPEPTSSPQATQSKQPQPEPTPEPTLLPSPPSQDPFAEFPVYPGAQQGSLGLLPGDADKAALNTADTAEQVVTFYEKELPVKGFEAKLTTDESNLKVYSVSKGGVSRYLHLIFPEENTVIVAANQPLALESLKDVGVEPPEAREFDTVIKQLINVDLLPAITLNELQNPAPFQSAQVSDIFGEVKDLPLQQLGVAIEDGLRSQQFTVEVIGDFGGGPLYRVKKGRFTGYISLAPSQKQGRTGVITLKTSPI